MLRDTSYALVRRLNFIESALREYSEQRGISKIIIADIGCGTGELLTLPLSLKLGNTASIYAYEPEAESYAHLCHQIGVWGIDNIHPIQQIELLQIRTYDAIIVSEVIEHVQDPIGFLKNFRTLLKEFGVMIITTPNGYGIFEIETLVFNSLDLIGVIPFLKSLRRRLTRSLAIPIKPANADTLAISPHINFFTLRELYLVVREAGLSLIKIEGRNLAAGPFSDKIIDKNNYLIELNSRLGKTLPLVLAADWMLIAENKEISTQNNKPSQNRRNSNVLQNIYTKYKRWLNLSLSRRQ